MTEPQNPLVVVAFVAITFLAVGTALALLFRAFPERRTRVLAVAIVTTWMSAYFLAARAGLFAREKPPLLVLVFAGTIAAALSISLSRVGARIAARVPLHLLVLAMAFRVPLEIVLRALAAEGRLPLRMTLSGANFDIVPALLALPIALAAWKGVLPRAALFAWNALGLVTVVIVASIGVASSPMIHAFGAAPEDVNTLVEKAPFVWLPTVLVAFALSSHLVILRALVRSAREEHAGQASTSASA